MLPVLFTPAESGRRKVSEHWYETSRRDTIGIVLYWRHYSCKKPKPTHWSSGFCGPGESITLITGEADALFVWKAARFRLDDQVGVECCVFRNEGPILSSLLIREAVEIARRRWPRERLFTYVDGSKVGSANPGYCFLKAGWVRLKRMSSRGLRILEYG